MHVRVVRFTGVSAERIDQLATRIQEAGGTPPGVRSTGGKLLFDEAQGTALSIQEYATAQDMEAAAKIFGAMDPSETPGSRVSVDECEVKLEVPASAGG
jgi:hypothetical protein